MPETPATTLRPLSLKRDGEDRLLIEWSDGHHGVLTWNHLRESCPCAGCNDERTKPADPFRILKPAELTPLKPTAFQPIGYYAYKIVWSDGHDSGLFTLENLRALCECPSCRGQRAGSRGQ